MCDGDGGGHDGGEGPDIGDHQEGGFVEHREEPCDQIDPGRDHRGGVDQGADRSRTLHRVGKPDVKRELGRLADRSAEEAETHEGESPGVFGHRARLKSAKNLANRESVKVRVNEVETDGEPKIADPVGQESLFGGGGRAVFIDEETDQEERGDSHQFPANIQNEQVVGENQ